MLVVNSSTDNLVLGKVAYLIESNNLRDSFFDIVAQLCPKRFYINLLRYIPSQRAFAYILIPKRTNCSANDAKDIDIERALLLNLLSFAKSRSEVTINFLVDVLTNQPVCNELPFTIDEKAKASLFKRLDELLSNPIFNCSNASNSRIEYDFALFTHTSTTLFLYKRNTHQVNNDLLGKLLSMHINSAYEDSLGKQNCEIVENFSIEFHSLFLPPSKLLKPNAKIIPLGNLNS